MRTLYKNTLYRHYKNRWYYVLDKSIHSETREEFVTYFPLYLDELTLFVRPIDMFLDEIESNKINETINQKERFLEINSIKLSENERNMLDFLVKDFLKSLKYK